MSDKVWLEKAQKAREEGFASKEETDYLLSSIDNKKHLEKSIEQLRKGKVVNFDTSKLDSSGEDNG